MDQLFATLAEKFHLLTDSLHSSKLKIKTPTLTHFLMQKHGFKRRELN